MVEISAEEKFKMVVPALFGLTGALVKGLDKKFGAEGRSLLAQIMGGFGSETGKTFKPQCPSEDFKTASTFYFSTLASLYGLEIKMEPKESEVLIHVPKCPFGLEGTNRELCEAAMQLDANAIKTLSPEAILEVRKTVATGDPECLIAIKPKR